MLIMRSSWFGMDLGKMHVKLLKFGIVLGGFALHWENQMESKKTPGHGHHLVGMTSSKKQGPAENRLHLLQGQPHHEVPLGFESSSNPP